MSNDWKTGVPSEAGWYDVKSNGFSYGIGRAYWNGSRWTFKKKGATIGFSISNYRKDEPKLTPWFPADVKPVRVGWYDRAWNTTFTSNDYWDGKNWFNGGPGNRKNIQPSCIPLEWRGIQK